MSRFNEALTRALSLSAIDTYETVCFSSSPGVPYVDFLKRSMK
jgi:hypothetical protein